MNQDYHQIAAAAAQLAAVLPHSVMLLMSSQILRFESIDRAIARELVLQSLQTPDFRDAAADFFHRWHVVAPSVGADAVSVALATAAKCMYDHRHEEIVEIVWTGPEPGKTHFRQTEQAILEVVTSAKERLTVVCYAVYRIPRIREALIGAASRGVQIRVIVETPNRIEGQGEYDCILALGDQVASVCSVYFWPQENRARDENGKIGILHVKCAVADSLRMFLSSANFTEYAFTINMELGLLVTGGKLPRQVEWHFDNLIRAGSLIQV